MNKDTVAKLATVLSLVGAISYAVNHFMTGATIEWSTLLGAFTTVAAAFGYQSFATLGK